MLRAARRQPEALVIGIDTAAEAMRESSQRASRRLAAGGAPNALFLVGDATRPDGLQVLAGRVDDVRVTLPWGSLARAVLDAEPGLLDGLAALLRPGGRLSLLLSLTDRDLRLGRMPLADAEITRLAHALAAGRFAVCAARPPRHRPMSLDSIRPGPSGWASRTSVRPG